jgi:cyanophycinase
MQIKGILIPIGGNEDKGIETKEKYHLEFIEEGILARVAKECGGCDKSIAVIPTASSIPDEVSDNYIRAFDRLGCTNVKIVDIRAAKDSEDARNISVIEQADCVMFSGGSQSTIVRKIGGSTVHNILLERYENESIVIAGTSAGAMCMSQEMISGGSSKESFIKGAVRMKRGMGFMSNLIIDSHFITRGRFGRLAEAIARFPDLLGVGLAEDTGLVIKNCNTFEVIGSGMVILFDPSEIRHNNEKLLSKGMPMSISNLKTHILANGDRFNIEQRKLKVTPSDKAFIVG